MDQPQAFKGKAYLVSLQAVLKIENVLEANVLHFQLDTHHSVIFMLGLRCMAGSADCN